jgi:hypothetical protein
MAGLDGGGDDGSRCGRVQGLDPENLGGVTFFKRG